MKNWFRRNKNSILAAAAFTVLIIGMSMEEPIPETTTEQVETEYDIIKWKDESVEEAEEVEVEEAEVVTVTKPIDEEPELVSLSVFKLTAYCSCYSCSSHWGTQTATGTTTTEGRTVAVDPTVIPYGTVLIINGHEYVAEDCGGSVKGNHIDIYHESHEAAKEFGIQYAEVFVKGGEKDES